MNAATAFSVFVGAMIVLAVFTAVVGLVCAAIAWACYIMADHEVESSRRREKCRE